jgi:antitoxin (DNA-binding transcriptional repressor) of toxin-antitoxin stability system
LEIHTVEEWQENFDEYMDRVEKGEHIGITDGENTAVMVPVDDDIAQILCNHDDGC